LAVAVAVAGSGVDGRCDAHVRCYSDVAVVDRRRLTKTGGAGMRRARTRRGVV